MGAFRYEIESDGIALVTFDLPGEKVNKLTLQAMEELDALLDEIATHREIKALVFRSGKEGHFIVGADIAEIRGVTDPAVGERFARKGQSVFGKIEALPFPTVAAIHGPCMGGGMELALACTYRVLSDDQRTALALPEVRLGIIPGFGGTQRLPRLAGLSNALDMILTGKSVYARKARRIGLADEVTFRELVLDRARIMARQARGRKRPTGVRARRPLFRALVEDNPLTRPLVYRMAAQRIRKETRGNYPAPLAALDAMRYGLRQGAPAGYLHEAKLLGSLIPGAVSKNLISVFYLNERLKKDPAPAPLAGSRAGVLGAGVMGGGIAQLFAEKGLTVRMKDVTTKAVAAGLAEAWGIFAKLRKKGVLTPLQARDGFNRITGTAEYSGLGTADIVVEAVVEDLTIKQSVLREFEQNAKATAIFASNTSSLSITALAAAARRPTLVIGMHFFNPVEKMPLVEIVRGKETAADTVAMVATLARRLGKLPVVVNDGPGFLVNRILMPYLNEAALLVGEGAKIDAIDGALRDFGMPMGAFILLDEIGIDVAHKVADILHRGLGERVRPAPLLAALHGQGYLGRKNGKGFYCYEKGKRGEPDPAVVRLIGQTAAGARSALPEEIVGRTILLMIKEAALCLEEGIIDAPDLLDAALVFGIGFPPFRGGLLRYADALGIPTVVEQLDGYARTLGDRFSPPTSLREMAHAGKRFFP